MPLPVPQLQNPFLRTLQPALPPAADTGPQMSMEDYASIAAEQWPIQMSAGFMEPEGMRTSNMGVFSDQQWQPDGRYGSYPQTFTGGAAAYFQQAQDFGQEGDLDGDIGNIS